jgi:hypothetical protein
LLADVEAALAAAERCMRDVPNRHGHTAANPYPGADGWTEAYAEQRFKDAGGKARARSYVDQMKAYAAFVATLVDIDDDKVKRAVNKLYFEDANRLDDLEEAVEILRGAGASKHKTTEEALEAFLDLPASRVNMRKLRKPFRIAKRGEPTIWYSFDEKRGYEFDPKTR